MNSEIREGDKRKDVGIDGKGSPLLPEKRAVVCSWDLEREQDWGWGS